MRLALGDAAAAASELAALVEAAPRDSGLRVRLADACVAAGQAERARALRGRHGGPAARDRPRSGRWPG